MLFPSVVLPLHVFEPRYRALVQTCLEGDREFGVVLIERGSEVGGDDVRTDVGTVARIVEAERATPTADGSSPRSATRRIRVRTWLRRRSPPAGRRRRLAGRSRRSPTCRRPTRTRRSLLRRVLALKAELGEPAAPVTVELTDDPVLGAYQLGAIAPIGPADQQAILQIDTVEHRLELVGRVLADEADFLERRLALG